MTQIVDFHTHSTASDGQYTPAELYAAAHEAGVGTLALTDHDTVAGFRELRASTELGEGPRLVAGIEVSSLFNGRELHIVGLNVDADSPQIQELERSQLKRRLERAEKICERLRKNKIDIELGNFVDLDAKQLKTVGRPDIARELQRLGVVDSFAKAFDKWLAIGKKAYVKADWPSYEQVIALIHDAGGRAVLAHPLKYKLTRNKIGKLVEAFKAAGGDAVELVSGAQQEQDTYYISRLAQMNGLAVSLGSDFHFAGASWQRLGVKAELCGELPLVLEAL